MNWRSPVLLIHGDDDRNVPFEQTIDLIEKLRAQNVAFEELIIPDEIHDLLRWSDWIRAYRAATEFFDRRLAAPAEITSENVLRFIAGKICCRYQLSTLTYRVR